MKVEIGFWEERVDEFSGQLIRKAASIMTWYVCSDSGKFQIGGRVEKKGAERIWMRFQVTLELWETEASSTYRELRSIECGLLLIAPEARGTVVRYGNDNYSAVRAVMFGSTKPDCQRIAVKIHDIVEAHQIELEMVWRRRSTEEIVLCDRISKEFDLSEYRIQEKSFERLARLCGPFSIDWFASDWSHQLGRFCSKYWTLNSSLTDAFCQDWSQEVGFFQPPVGDLARVLEKMETDGAKGVLVVPDWPGSQVDCLMKQAGRLVKCESAMELEYESPLWMESNTFSGWPSFKMSIFRIK